MSEAMQMILDCEARESRLSDWEREFIESLKSRLEAGKSATPRQLETLGNIWESATDKG